MTRRVLLVGATGAFGTRLAVLLAANPDLDLILAARRAPALAALRERLAGCAARTSTLVLDRAHPDLATAAPWLVVDAAGPFQASDYALARAAIRAGAHYIDLADARAFVAGFAAALDAEARAAGVLAVTGASSTPALSHAALAPLVAGWQHVDSVTVTITPGARAPRGLSVMQAILSYAGRPVRVFQRGGWRDVPGWSGLRRVDMPGLGMRLASICETPDLDLLPARFPVRRDALFTAGLELPVMHLGLGLLSLLVRWRLVASLRPLARPLRAIAGLLAPLGTDRGGMTIEAEGRDADGTRIRARWALWAAANAGPNVPVAAAAALIRALAEGREPRVGALPCVGLLEREAILRELAHLPIETATDAAYPNDPVLFRRLAGPLFDAMPPCVRAVHGGARSEFSGRAVARCGARPVARLLRRILALPPSGHHPVNVRIAADRRGETWTRRFGSTAFASRLQDTSRLGVFEERFGPLRFAFALRASKQGVVWHFRGWSLLGLPLPARLAPRIRARADERAGRYHFAVLVAHPWLGLLFAYRGWLAVALGHTPSQPAMVAKPLDPC